MARKLKHHRPSDIASNTAPSNDNGNSQPRQSGRAAPFGKTEHPIDEPMKEKSLGLERALVRINEKIGRLTFFNYRYLSKSDVDVMKRESQEIKTIIKDVDWEDADANVKNAITRISIVIYRLLKFDYRDLSHRNLVDATRTLKDCQKTIQCFLKRENCLEE